MDFEAGIADGADSDRVGKALEEGKVDMAVEPFCLEAGEAVGDRLEGGAYGVEMVGAPSSNEKFSTFLRNELVSNNLNDFGLPVDRKSRS